MKVYWLKAHAAVRWSCVWTVNVLLFCLELDGAPVSVCLRTARTVCSRALCIIWWPPSHQQSQHTFKTLPKRKPYHNKSSGIHVTTHTYRCNYFARENDNQQNGIQVLWEPLAPAAQAHSTQLQVNQRFPHPATIQIDDQFGFCQIEMSFSATSAITNFGRNYWIAW